MPRGLFPLPVASSFLSTFSPPLFDKLLLLLIFFIFKYSWISSFHLFSLHQYKNHPTPSQYASQESNRRVQEGYSCPRLLPWYVFLDPEPPPHRVNAIWVSLASRISADSINIDMIKDAIVNVSRSPSTSAVLWESGRAPDRDTFGHVATNSHHRKDGGLLFLIIICWLIFTSIAERAQW